LANEAEDNSHRKQCQQPPLFQQHQHCSAQKLQYTPKLIKTLNPTKALLIVENELHAYDRDVADGAEDVQLEGVQERRTQWKTKLDALVKENEALIRLISQYLNMNALKLLLFFVSNLKLCKS